MSGSLMNRLIAEGNATALQLLEEKVAEEWLLNKTTDTIMIGFRYVISDSLKKTSVERRNGIAEVTYEFWGDGSMPEAWALAIAREIPDLKISFLAVDPHSAPGHQFAATIAVREGVYIRERFNKGMTGSYERVTAKLLEKLSNAHSRILPSSMSPPAKTRGAGYLYEAGMIEETVD